MHKKHLQKAQEIIEKKQIESSRNRPEAKNDGEVKFRTLTPEYVRYISLFRQCRTYICNSEDYGHLARHSDRVNLSNTDQGRERAITFMQKLVRGRAIQNMMYTGKEKRLTLIEELLAVANIQQKANSDAEEDLLQAHEAKLKDAVLESIQGEVMARTFDMLSKELVRFKQVFFVSGIYYNTLYRRKRSAS